MVRILLIATLIASGTPVVSLAQPDLIPDSLRFAPSLKTKNLPQSLRLHVGNSSEFISWIKSKLPEVSFQEERSGIFSITGLRKSDIDNLKKSPHVLFFDRANRKAVEERALGAFDFTLNSVTSLQQTLTTLTGEGLVASIKEKPFDQTDIDFKGRVVMNSYFDEPPTIHASIMATIVAGAGNSEPSGNGIARGAGLTTSDFSQLLPDDGNELQSLGVFVQNHSYGVGGVENYYGIESSAYDQHCNDFPSILHVFSSGNEGDQSDNTGVYSRITGFANLTGQFKTSKNTLAVGSSDITGQVVTKSSRGPAHDGRVKPELIAFGDAGSSEAAAVVSGIALLIQQAYIDQNGGTPPSSLIKAAIINSADDSGRPEVDFEAGFGNVDALGSAKTIVQNRYFNGTLSQGQQLQHSLNVPSGTTLLKVTLVWNDIEAQPNATKALVNDLDLRLRNVSSGQVYKPWVLSHFPHPDSLLLPAKRKEDHRNNIEQVTIQLPDPGDYEIIITGFDVPQGPQAYSIAYEYTGGFEWINPNAGQSWVARRNNFIRWRWNEPTTLGKLEYRFKNESLWTEIANNLDLSSQYFPWLTPDTTAQVQLRMTINGVEYESQVFSITNPMAMKVGYNCQEEVMLVWNAVPHISEYQVYQLGDTYLEPFLVTPDTFAILNTTQKEILHYAVSPVLEEIPGLKSTTIDYTATGTACYFISFTPRQFVVENAAVFDLIVGTTFKLGRVVLEKLFQGNPIEVMSINNVGTTQLELTDTNPDPGSNFYRVRLINDQDETIYTSLYEEVYYARPRDLFVFPNPILPGQFLNIIVGEQEPVRVRLYDVFGRPLREVVDGGMVKTIDTGALLRGTYILEVLKANGQKLSTRVIIL